jgi:hypothetical protein
MRFFCSATNHRAMSCQTFPTVRTSMSIQDQPLARPGSQIVSPPERAPTDAHAPRLGDALNHVETSEEPSDVTDSESSLFALGGLGLAGIAMVGWICALTWMTWRLGAWLLS